MRSTKHHRSLFSTSSKSRRSLVKAWPIFVAEPLEARQLLSATLSTGPQTPADLPLTVQPLINTPAAQAAKITAIDGAVGNDFGEGVAISGNTAVVGAPNATVNGNSDQGAAYVFIYAGSDSGWEQVAKLTASDGVAYSSFGYAVAIDGTTIVVGEDDGGVSNDTGAEVYVFTEPGTGWTDMTQTATLMESDGMVGDDFGYAVAVSGNTIVAGSWRARINGNAWQGAAYVFTEPDTGWVDNTETAKLTASDGARDDCFGLSVGISGNTVVVGAPYAMLGGFPNQGAAYVFTEPSTGWADMTQTAKLAASNPWATYDFGQSVAISGSTIVVGQWEPGSDILGDAYVFTEPGLGWTDMFQTAKLTASDGFGGDYFGYSVGISGNSVVVGAQAQYPSSDPGVAYLYTASGGAWQDTIQTSEICASDGAGGDEFGCSVAISGNTVLVGARLATIGGNRVQGAAYLFTGPVIATITLTPPANQTATAELSSSFNLGSFGQFNSTGPYSVDVHWGDGSADSIFSLANTGVIPDTMHAYPTSGNQTVSITVTDLGSYLTSNTATFIINVAPAPFVAVTPPSNQSAALGQSTLFALGNFTQYNTSAPYSVDVNWGDGTTDSVFSLTSAGAIPATAHTYTTAVNDTVTVTVADAGSRTSSATFTVDVASIVVTPPGNQTVNVGQSQSVSLGSFAQFNATNPYSVDVHWGDGTADSIFGMSYPAVIPATAHTYAAVGNDVVTVTVTDSDNHTSNLGIFTVNVVPVLTLSTLASFNGSNGNYPHGLTIDSAGNIYGVTAYGGNLSLNYGMGDGTIFNIAAGNNTLSTLVTFNGNNGSDPDSLVADAAGNLYGTTDTGGANGYGTVFKIAAGTNNLTTLATFNGTGNGRNPGTGLIVDAAGNLYGMTSYGGASNKGTAFKIAASDNSLTTLVTFNGTNGSIPFGGLIADAAGNLYGTTSLGGANGNGTVFEIAAGNNTLTTLFSFNGANGNRPYNSLVMDGAGNLYGTTNTGGANGNGTVFEINPGNHTMTTLVTFNGTNGANPNGSLLIDAAGNLYGTAYQGGNMSAYPTGFGTVFTIAAGSNTATTLLTFTYFNGYEPWGNLIADAAGNIYGTAEQGGPSGDGVVFAIGGSGFVTKINAGITVTPPANQISQAGQSTSFALGSFTQSNATAPFSVDVHWGDGTADSLFSVPAAGTIPSTTHTYASAGSDMTTITVTDSASNTSNVATFTVTVTPAWLDPASIATWNAGTLTVTGSTTITADPGTFGDIPTINVSGTASVVLNTGGSGSSSFNIGSLSLPSGATLDVGKNLVRLANTAADPLSTIQNYIFSNQIISSALAAGYSLGYGNVSVGNSTYTEFGYTLKGDAMLTGTVGVNDLSIVLANYGHVTTQWQNGNFEYNPAKAGMNTTVNINDLSDVLGHYGITVPSSMVAAASVRVASAPALAIMADNNGDLLTEGVTDQPWLGIYNIGS